MSLRAIGGLALRSETASALRLCTLQAPLTRRDLAPLGRARYGAIPNDFLPAFGTRLTTATRRQARPSGNRYFPFSRSRQTSLRSDCRSSGDAAGFATAKPGGRSARPRMHEFWASGRRQTHAAR